jgi:hypothetical protein
MSELSEEPYGLMLEAGVNADELRPGSILVLNGHVVDVRRDPDDPERVRLVLVRALEPKGKMPDQREIEVICRPTWCSPRRGPHNIELAPLPARP